MCVCGGGGGGGGGGLALKGVMKRSRHRLNYLHRISKESKSELNYRHRIMKICSQCQMIVHEIKTKKVRFLMSDFLIYNLILNGGNYQKHIRQYFDTNKFSHFLESLRS